MWFKKRVLCIHCNKIKTKRTFEQKPTCSNCKMKILMSREDVYTCPVHGIEMAKEDHEGIIIDRCPICNGVWLDSHELKAIKEAADSGMTIMPLPIFMPS